MHKAQVGLEYCPNWISAFAGMTVEKRSPVIPAKAGIQKLRINLVFIDKRIILLDYVRSKI